MLFYRKKLDIQIDYFGVYKILKYITDGRSLNFLPSSYSGLLFGQLKLLMDSAIRHASFGVLRTCRLTVLIQKIQFYKNSA